VDVASFRTVNFCLSLFHVKNHHSGFEEIHIGTVAAYAATVPITSKNDM